MELCFLFLVLFLSSVSTQEQCSTDYCQNGGVCVVVIDSPRCACPPDTLGDHCENLVTPAPLPTSPEPTTNVTDTSTLTSSSTSTPATATTTTTTPTTTTTTPTTTNTTPTTTTTTTPTTTTVTTTTTPAPTTSAVCIAEFCTNGGVCVNVLDKPVCACPGGFSGTHCETNLDATTSRTTTSTTTTTTSTTTTSTTTTPTTTTSTTTTTPTPTTTTTAPTTTTATGSSCTADFCLNSGVCVEVLGKPVCACPEGVSGSHCERGICSPDYCANQGVCVVVLGKPVCACPDGIKGTHCESTPTAATTSTMMTTPTTTSPATSAPTTAKPSFNACDNQPCLFGGLCTPLSGGRFECSCPKGYVPPVCLPAVGHTDAAASTTSTTAATTTPTTVDTQCDTAPFDGCGTAEVVFMVTYSSHDDSDDIDHEGDFIKYLISEYQIDSSHIRVGLVVYHDDVTEAIHITDYAGDKRGLLNRVDTLTTERRHMLQPSGDADLARALTFVKDNSFKGARPGAKKVVIPIIHIIGSGLNNVSAQAAVEAARQLKQDCVQIFAQSVERELFTFLNGGDTAAKIATAPSAPYYSKYSSFNNLEDAGRHVHHNCRNRRTFNK